MNNMTDYKIDRPIEGDIQLRETSSVEQVDGAEFLRRIDRILALPDVAAVTWDQYTPYFNDGEPCEFRVGDPAVIFEWELKGKTVEEAVEERDYDGGYNTLFGALDDYRENDIGYLADELHHRRKNVSYGDMWTGNWPNRVLNKESVTFITTDGKNLEPYYDALSGLKPVEWETVALQNFGDHATVIATREGFQVQFYEHE